MHYSILETLENDTSAERLQNAVKENLETVNKACLVIQDQANEIARLKHENLILRNQNLELQQDLAEATGGPFKNEDYND